MELLTIFWRTIATYFFVFLMLRLMGKREIGKLSVFDLVISIIIAEIAVFIIEDPNKSVVEGALPMVTLVCIQLLIAWISLKSLAIRRLFDGHPSYIIEKGKLNRDEMRKQRYNLSDLMLQLRMSNVTDIADVEYAILETTGKLTVVKKSDLYGSRPPEGMPSSVQPGFAAEASAELGDEVQNQAPYTGLPLALIMDGQVLDENLDRAGRNRYWLKSQLQQEGIEDFKEVFFCSINQQGKLHIHRK